MMEIDIRTLDYMILFVFALLAIGIMYVFSLIDKEKVDKIEKKLDSFVAYYIEQMKKPKEVQAQARTQAQAQAPVHVQKTQPVIEEEEEEEEEIIFS